MSTILQAEGAGIAESISNNHGEGPMISIDLSKPAAYAGIGSRETPPDVLVLMTRIARKLDAIGWTLRSGGANGADTAFAKGTLVREIYIPWNGFNGHATGYLVGAGSEATRIASLYHPAWKRQRDSAKRLLARNTYQVLGANCASPSAFVLCWTPDGPIGQTTAKTGGTGQAIRIAHAYNVPIFNLKRDDHRAEWEAML